MKNLKQSLALLDDFFSSTKPEKISALINEVNQTCNMDISLDEYFSSMKVSFSVIIPTEDKYILCGNKEIVDIKAPSILSICEPLHMNYNKRRSNIPYKAMSSYNLAA